MKKLFLTLMVMLFAVMTVCAQQKPLVLGKSHAMQRVEVNSRYLLLPVQEREDNANIRVLVKGQQVQSLNMRLAVDKVDYYVPGYPALWHERAVAGHHVLRRPSFHRCHEGFPLLAGDEAEQHL